MNKTIYYNELKLTIGRGAQVDTSNTQLLDFTDENIKKLKKALSEFLQSGNNKHLFIKTTKVSTVFKLIKNEFYFIEAAGGLILKKNKYLFIKRLGKWDLPKGKLDKGELPEEAAIRECEEECAVKDLIVTHKLKSTHHIYIYKNKFALKTTYWYFMKTNYNKKLKPQIEENIEEVKWFNKQEIEKIALTNTYPTIENFVREILF